MSRTILITGAASGIGATTASMLRAQGDRVIGVDLRDADVVADISTAAGCAGMARAVAALTDRLDGVIANAGVMGPDALCYAVNYHGAIRTLTELRPLLLHSPHPRVAITSSMAAGMPIADEVSSGKALVRPLVYQLERGETPDASAANGAGYAASKVAICRWMRRAAVAEEWCAAGIVMNAVCPGVVDTPMGQMALQDPSVQDVIAASPLARTVRPEEVGAVLAFLVSEANSFMTGQVIYVDGGLNAKLRPEHV